MFFRLHFRLGMKKKSLSFLLAFFFFAFSFFGVFSVLLGERDLYAAKQEETKGTKGKPGGIKLGFVDIQEVMLLSSQGKKVKRELEQFFNKRKKSFQVTEKELKAMQADLEKKGSKMPNAVLAEKQKEWEKKMLAYRKKLNQAQLELQQREKALAGPILEKTKKIIHKMGEKEGYTMILQRSPLNGNLLWARNKANLTPQVIAQLEKKKVKAVSATDKGGEEEGNQPVKLAFVDIQKVMFRSSEGKKVKSELEKLFKEKKQELEVTENDLRTMQQDLEKKRSVLSDAVFIQKRKDLEMKMLAYRKQVGETQLKLQKREKDLAGPVLQKIKEIIQEIGKKNNYTMILQHSPLSDNLLWAQKEVDLTSQVIGLLEKKKKKKKKKK